MDRVLKLLQLLRGGDGWSGRELAEWLNVNPRTIYRDILSLRKHGVQIQIVGGRYRVGPPLRPSPWKVARFSNRGPAS